MKKIFFASSFLCFFSILAIAQKNSTDLSKILTKEQAEIFIEKNPNLDGRLFIFKPGEDAAEILSPLFNKKPGYIFKIDNYTYKLIGFDSTLSFRVSYIYLDGNKLSKEEIIHLREQIIQKYKSGVNFTELAGLYNMDGNTTGDTNWFTEKMMVEEFEKAVKAHKKGEIFTVDTPNLNWYHVVLKTYDNMYLKQVILMKVKSNS